MTEQNIQDHPFEKWLITLCTYFDNEDAWPNEYTKEMANKMREIAQWWDQRYAQDKEKGQEVFESLPEESQRMVRLYVEANLRIVSN